MKKLLLLLILATSITSCEKNVDQQRLVETLPEPSVVINSTVRVFAGSNPSVKIAYTLKNTTGVASAKLNNVLDVVVKDGDGILYDHQGGGSWYANYYFVFNMKNGKQIITKTITYYY